ncbi:ATP-binding cassette domain-containing protein (plasmid) [Clostridium estertheticum]|uniref:ATP-binding cassette domain-containing protein n=1 Tax=Clostridium estertheticum TaxID=238834 RepID=UPI001C7CF564|nr:ATP-binding cassette domain-containing protein [Clostridium estertheticum]MBX4260499.1 ATP-binding cassette domain-containing protein [Clostridium estertheticum]WLC72928.1 ATP-binding cassette domain-containing protein [Clostridium estertheticum]
MDTILKIRDVTKKYKNTNVISNLNMTIKKGEIYGFLGQNGAGKTTTLKMIMGLTKPTNGIIEVFGEQINSKKYMYKSRIGALIETPGFYPNLSALDNLEIHRRSMGLQDKKCIEEALNLVGLSNVKKKSVKNFSLGMKQRLAIARALLQKPELLILDEPTIGLDPVGISDIRKIILNLNKERKVTVIMSSHVLSEIQQMATKIGIIHKGVLLDEIEYKELEDKNKNYLQIRVNDDKKAAITLEQKCGINQYTVYENGIIRIFEKLDDIEFINNQMLSNGIGVSELNLNSEKLEDYFLRLIGGGEIV